MDRRTFLKTSTLASAAVATSNLPWLASHAMAQQKEFDPRPGAWRTFEITTLVQVQRPVAVTRVWVPVPSVNADYQRVLGNKWSGNAKTAEALTEPKYGAGLVYAEFAAGEPAPVLEVVSRCQTRSRALDWSKKSPGTDDAATPALWTASTDWIPTDGIVRETALEVTTGARTDVDRVRAIYDWILANTYREPKVRGCGLGDIKAMLETRNFGGKCADINALFVGLSRAAGVPARDVYGIRVAPSGFGYSSLGAGSPTITKAQHCRAEVHLRDYGWVAMDPADVTKVAREETSEWLKGDHPLVQAVRPKLFGGWEGNWLAYNTAHDIALPRATKDEKLGFLMYPQGETGAARLDELDPDNFKYTITTREIAA